MTVLGNLVHGARWHILPHSVLHQVQFLPAERFEPEALKFFAPLLFAEGVHLVLEGRVVKKLPF
jgi:hypothetical protein